MRVGWSRYAAWPLLLLLVLFLLIYGKGWLDRRLYPLPYRETVWIHAGAHDLDPLLVAAVIRTESRWRPGATSPKGARGLMQIMPETGRWIARQKGWPDLDIDRLYEPELNIEFGAWYLAYLRQDFDGDVILALAAYNGGNQNVRRWLQEKRWSGEHQTLGQIPFAETREYVRRVIDAYERYQRLYGGNQLDGLPRRGL